MPDDIGALRHQLAEIRDASLAFFTRIHNLVEAKGGGVLWALPPEEQTNLTFAVRAGFRGDASQKPFACNADFLKTAE